MTVTDISLLISRYLPEPHAGLLSGMLFGTRQSLSDDLYRSLIDSGTLHIVALSGTNITILIALVSSTVTRFFSRRISGILAGLIIIGFVLFVGPSPSVVRAAIMGCLAILAGVLGRQTWALWSLIVTVVAMLAFRPELISDISFQLSAGATLGLILFAGRSRQTDKPPGSFASRSLGAICDDLRITLAAQVFTIPLMVLYFRRLSLISPVSNLLIGSVLPPLTGIGIAFTVTALIFPPLATLMSYVLWIGLEFVIRVITVTAGIPFSSVTW